MLVTEGEEKVSMNMMTFAISKRVTQFVIEYQTDLSIAITV
jgi:hypothetical protein